MLTNRTYGEERHRQEAAVQRLATLRQHFGGLFVIPLRACSRLGVYLIKNQKGSAVCSI
jgi:hypothetical protein